MEIENAAAVLGKVGGKSGFGECKNRGIEHYKRISKLCWDKHRRPMSERFWEKVKKASKDECWVWTGCKYGTFGYGGFSVNNNARLAHRIAWELTFGEVPENLFVLHKCDNPPCVNPNHLFLGTKKENTQDMIKKGRKIKAVGERCGSAVLSESQVLSIRKIAESNQLSRSELAKMFLVSKSCIDGILMRKTWKHLP